MNKSQIEATTSVVSRESVATPEDVARLLELTPERREELKREQLLALHRSRARLSDNERRVARGIELEQHHRLTGNQGGLAEALMLQGRYAEAAEVAPTKEQKQEYLAKADAVTKDDTHCGCDRFIEAGEHNLPQQYIESYGHSLKHAGEIPFIRCITCGDLNAMPAPEHLIRQRALRNNPTASDRERTSFFKR